MRLGHQAEAEAEGGAELARSHLENGAGRRRGARHRQPLAGRDLGQAGRVLDEAGAEVEIDVQLFALDATEDGAADADGGERRLDGDVFGIGVADLAGDEDEGALQDREAGRAGAAGRIENHLVENDPAARFHGEGGVVDEADADRAVRAGLDHVVLENGIAFCQFDAGAVGVLGRDLAFGVLDDTDRGGAVGRRRLGVLARRQGSGEAGRGGAVDHRAVQCPEVGRHFAGEEVSDQNLAAVLAGQNQIGALAGVFGVEDKIAQGDGQLALALGFDNQCEILSGSGISAAGKVAPPSTHYASLRIAPGLSRRARSPILFTYIAQPALMVKPMLTEQTRHI